MIRILWLSLILIQDSYAALDKLIEYAAHEGSMHNVNSPAIVRDQAGGYMTGGSLLLRGPRPKELNPISIQTPKIRYDACTGSGDFRFGSMSYISAAEFSDFLKGVAKASGAYLVKMSIKTACPQCEDIMANLEQIARDINSFTINQCAMAQALTSGAISKLASSEKQRCMMEANAATSNTDMFDTTKKCQDSVGDKGKSSSELEDMLGSEFNLVWKALKKNGGKDIAFKELMMSVSGTIIGIKENERFHISHKPSLLHDKKLLEKFIGNASGNTNLIIYQCDEEVKCLHPKEYSQPLKPQNTLYGNVARIMRNLADKVEKDNPVLTDEEEALIGFSSIPILRLIEMEISYKARTEDIVVRLPEFIEVMCYDVITNYMQIMLSRVLSSIQNLGSAQIDSSITENFVADIERTRQTLRDAKFEAFQKLQVIMQVKENLNLQTKEFEFNFGRMMDRAKE